MFRYAIFLIIFLSVNLVSSQHSAAENQNAANNSQQPTSQEIPGIQSGNAGQADNNSEPNQTYANKWKEPIVILTLFLFAGVLIQAAIYTWQAILMRRSVNQTNEIVKAVERQAIAAEKALKLTQKHFDLTERPSLGMDGEMYWGEDPKTGEGFVEAVIKNSGKTPAVKVIGGMGSGIQVGGKFVPTDVCPEPDEGEISGLRSQNALAIGGIMVISSKNLTVEEFKKVLSGELQYFIWIHITYCKNAEQKTPYVFENYSRYHAETGTFAVCQIHNNAT